MSLRRGAPGATVRAPAVWETTIGLARAIEILIIVCGRPAGGPHRGPPSTARAGVTTDVQRTSNGRPTDVGQFI